MVLAAAAVARRLIPKWTNHDHRKRSLVPAGRSARPARRGDRGRPAASAASSPGRFDSRGARIAVCDIDEKALEEARAELTGALVEWADVGDPAQVAKFFEAVNDAWAGSMC